MVTGIAGKCPDQSRAFMLEILDPRLFSQGIWAQCLKIGTSEYEWFSTFAVNWLKSELILCRKFDKVPYFGYYKLLKPGIVVRGAELVKNVMIKDFASFQANDHNITKKSDPLFAQNPFFLNGDEWQAERKSITPTISPAKVWSYN